MGSYDTTLGALLIGIFLNMFLYGLVTYQFIVYYRTKFNDRPVTKYTVLFLFILDTFHSLSVIYMGWYYAVENYGNPAALKAGVWPYPFTSIGMALAATVTQVFLGIWCLTGSKILYGIVIMLAIPSCILGFACGIAAWIIHVKSELPRITPLVIAWLTMLVTLDVFITVTLVIVFTSLRTGFRKMDTIVNRLIRGAIQTGFFATIFALGDLIAFVVVPTMNFDGMFAIPLGRIYTTTLLDTLLARESLRAEMEGTNYVGGELRSLDWTGVNPPRTTSMARTSHIQFKTVPGLCSSLGDAECGMSCPQSETASGATSLKDAGPCKEEIS